jgi:hypothetical protein
MVAVSQTLQGQVLGMEVLSILEEVAFATKQVCGI